MIYGPNSTQINQVFMDYYVVRGVRCKTLNAFHLTKVASLKEQKNVVILCSLYDYRNYA